jgi:hypothetical protein
MAGLVDLTYRALENVAERKENRMTSDLQVNDVVQIDPDHDKNFGACFMVVTDPKPWGAQGYVQVPGTDGVAFYRCPHDAMALIGKAEWLRTRRRIVSTPKRKVVKAHGS